MNMKQALDRAIDGARACVAEIDAGKLPPEVAFDVVGVCGYFGGLINQLSNIKKPSQVHLNSAIQLERGAERLLAFFNTGGRFPEVRRVLFDAVFLAGAAAGQIGIVDVLMNQDRAASIEAARTAIAIDAANARHAPNRERNAKWKLYYQENRDRFVSIDEAASKISLMAGVKFSTAKDWIGVWRKGGFKDWYLQNKDGFSSEDEVVAELKSKAKISKLAAREWIKEWQA